jgi:hypothetical protein
LNLFLTTTCLTQVRLKFLTTTCLTQDRLEFIPNYLDLAQDRLELIPDYHLPHSGPSLTYYLTTIWSSRRIVFELIRTTTCLTQGRLE